MLAITHERKQRQNWIVLEHLLTGDGVDIRFSVNVLNVVGLTARIAELKKLGFKIDWRWEVTEQSRYKKYFIKDTAKARALYEDILSGNNPQKTATPSRAKTKQTQAKIKQTKGAKK